MFGSDNLSHPKRSLNNSILVNNSVENGRIIH